ncbi:MAG: C25 family cysteine peptidase [Solirubrobacterales bacterium]
MLFQEPDWRFCWKCQEIFKGPDATGVCPADGVHHDPSRGGDYVIFNETASIPPPAGEVWAEAPSQETGWRHCSQCEALFLSAGHGVCPAGRGDHLDDGSHYRLLYDGPYLHLIGAGYQLGWRRCVRCQSCYLSGNRSAGACPAGAEGHVPDERNYALQAAGPLNDGVDAELLIVAPPDFTDAVLPLVEHRRRDLTVRLLTFDDELKSHYTGRDDAARLKTVIGYAAEYLRTRYVFLVGGGSAIPLRYRYSDHDGDPWEKGVRSVTDLYYANLYEDHAEAADGFVTHRGWSSWGANGDGFYNYQDWSQQTTAADNPDRVDGYPDLAVGRLPAGSADEVSAYVEKLLAYEEGRLARGGGKLSLLGDGGYEGIVSCEGLIVSEVPLPGPEWPTVDRIGFRYAPGATLPAGSRRAGEEDTPATITETSS